MSTPQQLQAEVEAQREQLAATIDELHERLQVQARSAAKVAAVVAGTALIGVVVVVLWRRTHR